MKRRLSRCCWSLLMGGCVLLHGPLWADDVDATARQEWMAGYVRFEEGGRAEEGGDVAQALVLYREALQTFEAVRRQYPGWNPSLLGYRITYCTQRIRRLESQVKQQSPEMSQQDLARVVSGQVDKIRALSDENEALKARLATTADSLERARAESARTVTAAEDIKDVMAERARLKEANAALQQQIEQQSSELGTLRQKSGIEQVAKQLQEDLERTRAREKQLEEAFDTYRRAYENVKEKLRQTTAEQELWQRQNRDLNDRTDAAVASAAEARGRAAELGARNAVLEQQRTDGVAALAQKDAEAEQVRQDLATARVELEGLRRLRDQATQESVERQRLGEQAQLLAAARAAAEERVAALETELQEARERIAFLEARPPPAAPPVAPVVMVPPAAAVPEPAAGPQPPQAAVAEAAALRREVEALRTELAQERQRAERLAAVEAQGAALLRERVEAQRQLATARGTIETQQALLQAQGESQAAASAVGHLLEDKEKALAATVAEVEALRQDLIRERTALAAKRDEARESQAALQQLSTTAADLEKQNVALAAQVRDRARVDEDSSRSRQDAQDQLRQTRDLLAAAEGERAQMRQKAEEQLTLLRQQEKGLRDLEQQRRELADRTDILGREVAALKESSAAQAAAFARDAASMKAKSEVVDGLAASLSDADALTQDLKRQIAVLQQDKAASETRFLEARRETQEREQELARYRSAAVQDATAKEKALMQQLRDAAARLETEAEKRRALEAALASLPAASPALPPVPAAASTSPAPVDPESERREREQATLVRGYLRQAVAAEKEGKIEAARWNYLRVLEHDGESELAAQRLGLLAAEHGNDEEAERYLKRAFTLDPDDLQTIVPLGFALLRRQEPDLALSMLSRAVALEPTNAVAQRCLGLACSSLGWYDAAEVQFRRAHELNPKDAENAFNLAVLLSSRQPPRQEEARQWYERALSLGSARDPGLDRLFGLGK